MQLTMQISLEQKPKLVMRLELLQQLYGTRMRPKADCACGHKLTAKEIIAGFCADVLDTTTQCPQCKTRFQPYLHSYSEHHSVYMVNFFCASQALARLTNEMTTMKPREIRRRNASLYHSILAHFGTFHAAFKKFNGFEYTLDKAQNWRVKIRPFLGEYPDSMIACSVGVSRSSVQRYRTNIGIHKWVSD